MSENSVSTVKIKKITTDATVDAEDVLAAEEPLEVCLAYGSDTDKKQKNISVTMRTPGNDIELALGFLFTEGIIKNYSDVSVTRQPESNSVIVELKEGVTVDLNRLERNFYTSSSCGVCGKTSIASIRTVSSTPASGSPYHVSKELILSLPQKLSTRQTIFESTGGLHASALFDRGGNLILVHEDVGRHNALDKLIGAAISNSISFENKVLLLSGRASFELIQKAAMAGIKIVCAVGAPSGLAVESAKEFDITLIGFLRDKRFNVYSNEKRILI